MAPAPSMQIISTHQPYHNKSQEQQKLQAQSYNLPNQPLQNPPASQPQPQYQVPAAQAQNEHIAAPEPEPPSLRQAGALSNAKVPFDPAPTNVLSATGQLGSLPSPTSSISESPLGTPAGSKQEDGAVVPLLPADALHEAISSLLDTSPVEPLSNPVTPARNPKPQTTLFQPIPSFDMEDASSSSAFTEIFGRDIRCEVAEFPVQGAHEPQPHHQHEASPGGTGEQHQQHGHPATTGGDPDQAASSSLDCGVGVDFSLLTAAIDDAAGTGSFQTFF